MTKEELQLAYDTAKADLDTRTTELATANEKIEALETENTSLKEQLETTNTTLADTVSINDDLQAEIEKLSGKASTKTEVKEVKKIKIEDLSFEHNGQKIGFNYPNTVINKVAVTAEDIVASEELQAKLVKMQHGILKY